MSLARVNTVKKSRKEFTCGSCGTTIPKGSLVHHFAVGFRGRTQHRCEKHPPTRSDRESSLVGPVWDALDNANFSDCETAEDFEAVLQEVSEVFEEVAAEYESSEMYDRNPELQERAETLNSSASELQSISFDEEPDREDFDNDESHSGAMERWLEDARATAQAAIDDAEVP